MMMTAGLALAAALLVDVGEAKVISNSIYLAENQQKPGWRTTASGLQYKVVRSGPADGAVAGASSRVACTYTARLPHNGQELKAGTPLHRRERPGITPSYGAGVLVPSRVIKGLGEALELMRPGDAWELVVPPKLAYGSGGSGTAVPPNAILLWTVEVREVKSGFAGDFVAALVALGVPLVVLLRRRDWL